MNRLSFYFHKQRARQVLDMALKHVVQASRLEPHHAFYIHAEKCAHCHTAIGGIKVSVEKPAKYLLATVVNGEIIPRLMRLTAH